MHEWLRDSYNTHHSKEIAFNFPTIYKNIAKIQPTGYPEIIYIISEMALVQPQFVIAFLKFKNYVSG